MIKNMVLFHSFALLIQRLLHLMKMNGNKQIIIQSSFVLIAAKKIEISVVDEIDVSDKYNELTKQRDELWRKCQKTDSKKKESELSEQVRKLDDQINDFYELGEWKGEY